jgi:Flp pilus assembly protein TadG
MIGKFLKKLRADNRGVFAIELAMAAPILVGLSVGGVEITRYVILNQKIERTSAAMADLVSQAETLSESDLVNLFNASADIMSPFDLNADGRLVLSSVSAQDGNPPVINWQREYGGTSGGGSAIGTEGNTPSLPSGFIIRDNESVIVAEVYYDYEPMFSLGLVDPANLYTLAIFRPRFGSLTELN